MCGFVLFVCFGNRRTCIKCVCIFGTVFFYCFVYVYPFLFAVSALV